MSKATAAERYFLTLVNDERARHGLDPVQLDTRLNDSSEDHSRWLLQTDSFSHFGQGGSRVAERIKDAGFPLEGSWRVSENLALLSDNGNGSLHDEVRQMHVNLMDSDSHRASILDARVDYVGIGLEVGTYSGQRVVMATQNFAATQGRVELDIAPGITITTVAAPALTAPLPALDAWQSRVGDPHPGNFGTSGHDLITRGAMNDTVYGGAGSDWIAGRDGHDALHGGLGDDIIFGQTGFDRLFGGWGNDRLFGGFGQDRIMGGAGHDLLSGEAHSDLLAGGPGNDRLFGGQGSDTLDGGLGNDILTGGAGHDQLRGGGGADRFVFAGAIGVDRVMDFQPGIDRLLISDDLVGSDVAAFVADHVIKTSAGVVIAFSPDNRIVLADPDLTRQDVADDIFLF